jgi:alpha-tubulin suppressor-like RCC1 family protein
MVTSVFSCGGGGNGAVVGGAAQAPVFGIMSGTYAVPKGVDLYSETTGVSIRYTVDGSTPSDNVGFLYNGSPIVVSSTTTIKAIAYKLGYASSDVSSSTYTIIDPPKAVAVAAGANFTVVVDNTGNVWTWGSNERGQLGDGTTDDRASLVHVAGLSNVIAVATGSSHAIALLSDGTVWGWGSNLNGELGDGTNINRLTPVKMINVNNIVAVAAGYNHTLLLRNDGSVWACGDNRLGQVGDGTYTDRYVSTEVIHGDNPVFNISAGNFYSVAIDNAGIIFEWGIKLNSHGANEQYNRSTPAIIWDTQSRTFVGYSHVVSIIAGAQHVLVLTNTGSLWGWGVNSSCQLGAITIVDPILYDYRIFPTSNFRYISAGSLGSVAICNDNTLYSWGANFYGVIGDGTTTDRSAPTPVLLSDVMTVSAGSYHTVAIKNDGTVWAWGNNTYGAVGDGHYGTVDNGHARKQLIPVRVM